jgi:hypothetical protein
MADERLRKVERQAHGECADSIVVVIRKAQGRLRHFSTPVGCCQNRWASSRPEEGTY